MNSYENSLYNTYNNSKNNIYFNHPIIEITEYGNVICDINIVSIVPRYIRIKKTDFGKILYEGGDYDGDLILSKRKKERDEKALIEKKKMIALVK